jgi:DNA-binding transcriptional regulator LsrR (DeoR family)
MRNLRVFNDRILVEVCHRFMKGERAAQIRDWLNEKTNYEVTREDVFPLIREAVRRGYLVLFPPRHEVMRHRIVERYPKQTDKDRIVVVSVGAGSARDLLPPYAAHVVLSRIKELAATKERVHIGLGGGGTIKSVARYLAAFLGVEERIPKLAIHVLTSGFVVNRPENAPITFLRYFKRLGADIKCFGLSTPPVFGTDGYERVWKIPGVEESFKRAKQIDIVVTSLASADDPHGELNEFMAGERTKKGVEVLRKAGWVGDLQYHPYSNQGPITDVRARVRAVSLFDLAGLKKLAETKDKFVIVVGGPCGICERTKVRALRPLLQSDSMKVWTDLVMDLTTGEALLATLG